MSPGPPWAILDITWQLLNGGVKIIVITSTPVDLSMRCTMIEPKEHTKARLVRGVTFFGDKYYCFDVYDDQEQIEDGDTTTHTWIIPDWHIGYTHWCYFWGTIAAEVSPSTSAIFKYTPFPNIIFAEYYNLSVIPSMVLTLEEEYTLTPMPPTERIFEEIYSW